MRLGLKGDSAVVGWSCMLPRGTLSSSEELLSWEEHYLAVDLRDHHLLPPNQLLAPSAISEEPFLVILG